MIHIGKTWTAQEDQILEQYYGKIMVKDILARGLIKDRTEHGIRQRACKLGIKSGIKKKLYHNIRLDFFKHHTPESAYWAGFLCADGSLVKDPNKTNTYRLCLSISVKDEEHLKLFQKTMGHDGPIGKLFHEGGTIDGRTIKATEMRFVNICQAGKFVDDLANLGIIPDKTKRIPPPKLDSELLKLAFLKGLIDGDGCISISCGRMHIGIASSCKAILDWAKEVVDRNLSTAYMDRSHANVIVGQTAWHFNINGYRCARFIDLVSRIPTPELARKWKNPRVLEFIASAKTNPLFVGPWSIRLPIEDEIDAYLATLQAQTAASLAA